MAEIDTIDTVEKNRNHPLHLHSSDTPGSILTTIQLTGVENCAVWSRSMLLTLRAKSKLGFVHGTCKKSDYTTDLAEQWEKCNAFVLSWILNTVWKELMSGIIYASNAADVWADLKERFDKVDGSHSYQLHREICTIKGISSVSNYFTRLRLLWDEFDALVTPPSCGCDKSKVYVDHLQRMRLFAFLMGLNESYNQARSQILMMNPLPNVNKAYAMIISDENQKATAGTCVGTEAGEMTALYAAGKGNGGPGRFQSHGDMPTPYAGGRGPNGPGRYPPQGSFQKPRENSHLYGEVCNLRGHNREACWKIIGYPPDFKHKKQFGAGQRYANAVNADETSSVVAKGQHDRFVGPQPAFTQDQYNQILRLLNDTALDNAINMAGPVNWDSEGDW